MIEPPMPAVSGAGSWRFPVARPQLRVDIRGLGLITRTFRIALESLEKEDLALNRCLQAKALIQDRLRSHSYQSLALEIESYKPSASLR
jgi:hypothetical protein